MCHLHLGWLRRSQAIAVYNPPMLRGLLARIGYLAIGAVYAAVGVIAARVAFLGAKDRVAGIPGAFRFIVRQPHGVALLWGVVGGLGAFACWRFAEASRRRRGRIEKIGLALSGAGYAALASTGVSLLLRIRSGRPGGFRRTTLEWLLSQRWGAFALTATGAGILASALYQFYQAFSGRLRERFATSVMGPQAARLATRVARVGLSARAIVFLLVGYFLIRAARERDPSQFHEIGGALRLLSTTALGPWLMGIVALGLIAFALYMGTLALFRRS